MARKAWYLLAHSLHELEDSPASLGWRR